MTEQQAGTSQQLSPLVRRLLAPNPSAFTHTGTQTYIVGRGNVAVIDPGPAIDTHLAAILAAAEGEMVRWIVCTHTHRDHSPAAHPLGEATGAEIVGCASLALNDDGPRADAGYDGDYRPDRTLSQGDTIESDGWTLTAIETPGHTSNHLCFALAAAKALFTGDHVMGWSTTVVSPPDGDMTDYIASLEKLHAREDATYYPAHGDPIDNPRQFVRGLIGHRRQREGQILRAIDDGLGEVPAMVARMYKALDERLRGAAGRSVLAHLIDLRARGLVEQEGERWKKAA